MNHLKAVHGLGDVDGDVGAFGVVLGAGGPAGGGADDGLQLAALRKGLPREPDRGGVEVVGRGPVVPVEDVVDEVVAESRPLGLQGARVPAHHRPELTHCHHLRHRVVHRSHYALRPGQPCLLHPSSGRLSKGTNRHWQLAGGPFHASSPPASSAR